MRNQNLANEQHWRLLVLLLKKVAESKGLTHAEVAEKAGLIRSNVSRLFRLNYAPNLKTFIAVARAVGVHFFFEDKDSDTDLSVLFNQAMDELGRNVDKLPKN